MEEPATPIEPVLATSIVPALQEPFPHQHSGGATPCPEKVRLQTDAVRSRVEAAMARAETAILDTHVKMEKLVELGKEAEKCELALASQCLAMAKLFESVKLFTKPVWIGFKSEYAAPNPDREKFFQKVLKEIRSVFTWDAFTLKALRTEPGALQNYAFNLGTVLSFQYLGHLLSMYFNDVYNPMVIYPLIVNTIIFLTLESDKLAKNTELDLRLPQPESADELNAQIPAMIAGADGAKVQERNNRAGILGLWPFQAVIVSLLTIFQESLWPKYGPAPFDFNPSAAIVANVLVSLGIFGTYLAYRMSAWDSWFNSYYLRELKALNARDFERNRTEIEIQISDLLKKNGIVGPTAGISGLRALAFRFSADGRKYQQFIQQNPQARELIRRRSWNWWARTKSYSGEMGYRYGLNAFDAYVMFSLLGSWTPGAIRWLMGIQLPPGVGGG